MYKLIENIVNQKNAFYKQIFNLICNSIKKHIKEIKEKLGKRSENLSFYIPIAKMIADKKESGYIIAKLATILSNLNLQMAVGTINEIVVLDGSIFIYSRYVGTLIGKGGETIDKISKLINNNEQKHYDIVLVDDIHTSRYNLFEEFNFYESYKNS